MIDSKNNTGLENSGDSNSGYRNSGYRNSGNWNSGNWNSGNWNSGDCNSGDWNSGYRNSGYRNSGNWNSGNWNSGNWNACNYETGCFNTVQSSTIRVFNKDCNREVWENADKPSFIYFDLCVWVNESDMTDEQKAEDPDCNVRGGQLQIKEYKQAWKEAYDNASAEEIELLKALPNFDADVFEELTGIRVDTPKTCAGKVVEIDGVEYELKEIK